jgi:hypothetical protein
VNIKKEFIYVSRTKIEGICILGLFDKKLIFQKIELTRSKIDSDTTTTIKVNIKNFKESFDNVILKISTDDQNNEYLKISNPLIRLSSLTLPNQNTGEHEITIIPHNIPLNKMSFNVKVEVFGNDQEKPLLTREFNLTVNKK